MHDDIHISTLPKRVRNKGNPFSGKKKNHFEITEWPVIEKARARQRK